MGEAGGQGRWERMGSREAGLGDYKTDIVMIIIELEKLFQNRDIFHCQLSTGFFSSVFHYYKKHNCAITFKNCKNAMFFNLFRRCLLLTKSTLVKLDRKCQYLLKSILYIFQIMVSFLCFLQNE